MIKLELTKKERLQFQYILPFQGSLITLEMVNSILKKIESEKIENIEVEEIKSFEFEDSEVKMMKEMIYFLDREKKLYFQSLSLIRKILEIDGAKNE